MTWAIRLSRSRRGKAPSELDFFREIKLAKRFRWLRELPEDVRRTERYQKLYKRGPIRYGQTFVCLAKRATIKSQRARFVSEFVESAEAVAGQKDP